MKSMRLFLLPLIHWHMWYHCPALIQYLILHTYIDRHHCCSSMRMESRYKKKNHIELKSNNGNAEEFSLTAGQTEMLSSKLWQPLTFPLHPIDARFSGFNSAHNVPELQA